jgi:hypothetical protein
MILAMQLLRLRQPPTRRRVFELVVAGPVGRWFQRHRWAGFTLPLPRVVLIFYWNTPRPNPLVRVHEFRHVEQFDGALFIVAWYRYLAKLAVHGYRDNPYERDAYEVEADAEANGLPAWAAP